MKYLKVFENFRGDNLIDYVDFSLIEEIFDDIYHVDIDDALYYRPSLIWNNIKDKEFVDDFERDYLENQSLEDINNYDIKKYILENMTKSKEYKIREIYLDNNDGEDEEDLYAADDYENMLDEFNDDEIRAVIEEDENGYDVAHSILQGSFEGYTSKDIISEFYGIDPEFYDKKRDSYSYRNTYDDNFKELKKIVINYIDREGVEKEFKNGESDDYKKEFVEDYIERSPKIQRNIIANNPEKAIELYDLIEGNSDEHIGDEYIFQKAFIEQHEKENPEGYEDDEIRQNVIFTLHKEFGLDPKIEEEYPDDLILVTLSKYNL